MMRKAALVTLPKRFLTIAEACHVYGCTADYLEGVSADELPRNRRGHRTILLDVIDIERHFARFRVGGDEQKGKARDVLTALPVVVLVSDASQAA